MILIRVPKTLAWRSLSSLPVSLNRTKVLCHFHESILFLCEDKNAILNVCMKLVIFGVYNINHRLSFSFVAAIAD